MTTYTVRELDKIGLQKLTRRDIQGTHRPTIGTRANENIHYIPVHTQTITDRRRIYTAEQRNASILRRIQEVPGRSRVRFLYEDENGGIISTEAERIKDVSENEIYSFVRPEGKNLVPESGIAAHNEDDLPDDEYLETLTLKYIVWES